MIGWGVADVQPLLVVQYNSKSWIASLLYSPLLPLFAFSAWLFQTRWLHLMGRRRFARPEQFRGKVRVEEITMTMRNWRLWVAAPAALLFVATISLAAERQSKPVKTLPFDPNAQTVEMFAAIEKGDIAVKFIPKDSKEAKVLVENKTDKPLNVQLPETFAGVPILPQLGPAAPGAGGRPGTRGGGGARGGNQGMGGGMGGMGGMGGGFMNVPPEKVGEIKVPTVCLDHGKAEPRPAMAYEIKPLDTYTTKPGVRELCAMLGKGEVDQRSAQAAAWHLNNDMSWEQLAAKQLRYANGARRPYFSPAEIQAAIQVANAAVRIADERPKDNKKSSGGSASRGDTTTTAPADKK
jgi:hypothetical protein